MFELLPASIRSQLLSERDPHGNVQARKSKRPAAALAHEGTRRPGNSARAGNACVHCEAAQRRARLHCCLCCLRAAPDVSSKRLQQPQVTAIETEKLLVQLVEAELAVRRAAGTYSGKFSTATHFFGYEGR